jgi:hypothetical protein
MTVFDTLLAPIMPILQQIEAERKKHHVEVDIYHRRSKSCQPSQQPTTHKSALIQHDQRYIWQLLH